MLLKRRKLRHIAEVFAILLPIDIDQIIKFIGENSLAFCAVYVSECHKLNGRAFGLSLNGRSEFSKRNVARISSAIVKRISSETELRYEGNIINAVNLLSGMPGPVQYRVLLSLQPQLMANWIEASRASDWVRFLVPLNNRQVCDRTYLAGHFTSVVLGAMLRSIRLAPGSELQKLPRRIAITLVGPRNINVLPLVNACIERIDALIETRDARRVLWDALVYFPEEEERVSQQLANYLLAANPSKSMSDLELFGIASCIGLNIEPAAAFRFFASGFVLDEREFEGIDRWRVFLALIGLVQLQKAGIAVQTKRNASIKLQLLAGILAKETIALAGHSSKLLERVRHALGASQPLLT